MLKLIEIAQLPNGAHNNQFVNAEWDTIPEGWAVIPNDMEIPESFPFVDIIVEDGIVTSMTAREVPEPEPMPEPPPSVEDIILDTLADQEYRLCLMELGANG